MRILFFGVALLVGHACPLLAQDRSFMLVFPSSRAKEDANGRCVYDLGGFTVACDSLGRGVSVHRRDGDSAAVFLLAVGPFVSSKEAEAFGRNIDSDFRIELTGRFYERESALDWQPPIRPPELTQGDAGSEKRSGSTDSPVGERIEDQPLGVSSQSNADVSRPRSPPVPDVQASDPSPDSSEPKGPFRVSILWVIAGLFVFFSFVTGDSSKYRS